MSNVALFPGLQSEESKAEFMKLSEQRDRIDYECYMLLGSLLRDNGIAEYRRADVEELLGRRESKNDQMLRLVAGGPKNDH